MDSNQPDHIEKLLEKYWNCDSSLEEEQELKEWFSKRKDPGMEGNVRVDTISEEALFQYFVSEKKKETPSSSMDDGIFNELNVKNTKAGKSRRIIITPGLKNLSRIAAGIVVALAATFYVLNEKDEEVPAVFTTDTFQTPEQAYEETMKVLNLVSQKLNMGREQAAKISVLNEAEEAVKETSVN